MSTASWICSKLKAHKLASNGRSNFEFGFTRPAVEAKADEAFVERDPVAAAVDLFDRGMYFQCNFEPDTAVESAACQVLMSVKAARPGSQICEAARGLIDTSRTGLVMLGKAGLGTKFHVDRTQADNLALSVIDKVGCDPYIVLFCDNAHHSIRLIAKLLLCFFNL